MGCCCSKEVVKDEDSKEVRTPLLSEHRTQSGERLTAGETASNPKYQALEDTSPSEAPKSTASGDLEVHRADSAPDPATDDVLFVPKRSEDVPGEKRTKVVFEQALLQAASDTTPTSSELLYPATAEILAPPEADPDSAVKHGLQQSQDETEEPKIGLSEPLIPDLGEPTRGQSKSTSEPEELQGQGEPATKESNSTLGPDEPKQRPGESAVESNETAKGQADPRIEPSETTNGQNEPTTGTSEPSTVTDASNVEAAAAEVEPVVAEHKISTDVEIERPIENEGLYKDQEQRYKDLQDAVRNLELMYPEENLDRTISGCLTHVKHKCGDNVVLETTESFRLQFAEDRIDHSIIPALVEFNKAFDLIQELLSNGSQLSKSVADAITVGSNNSDQDKFPQEHDRYISKLKNIADMLLKIQGDATKIFKEMDEAVTVLKESPLPIGGASHKLKDETLGETNVISQSDDQVMLGESGEGIEPPLEDRPPSREASPGPAETIVSPVEETEQRFDSSQIPQDTDSQSRVTHIVQENTEEDEGEDSSEDTTEREEQTESSAKATAPQLEHDGPEAICTEDPDDSFRTEESGELDRSAYTEEDSFHDTHDEDHLPHSPSAGTEDFLQHKQEVPEFSVEHHNGHAIDDDPEQIRQADETFETPKFNSTMFDGSAMSPGDQSRVYDQSGSSPIGQSLLEPADKDRLVSMVSSTGGYETARDDTFNLTEYQGFSESSTDVSREETLSVTDDTNTTVNTTDASAHDSWIQSPDSVVGDRL